ncbi:MAG: hypothetical protein PS018_26535, partial [bacterium]|nr:hypothetical protein [bacterium]
TSIGKAAGQGFVKGLTLGVAEPSTPEQGHEAAVRRYLDLTSRSACGIQSGYELINTQYEFKIACPAGVVMTPLPSVADQASIPFAATAAAPAAVE